MSCFTRRAILWLALSAVALAAGPAAASAHTRTVPVTGTISFKPTDDFIATVIAEGIQPLPTAPAYFDPVSSSVKYPVSSVTVDRYSRPQTVTLDGGEVIQHGSFSLPITDASIDVSRVVNHDGVWPPRCVAGQYLSGPAAINERLNGVLMTVWDIDVSGTAVTCSDDGHTVTVSNIVGRMTAAAASVHNAALHTTIYRQGFPTEISSLTVTLP
jgi:hypothetical protein